MLILLLPLIISTAYCQVDLSDPIDDLGSQLELTGIESALNRQSPDRVVLFDNVRDDLGESERKLEHGLKRNYRDTGRTSLRGGLSDAEIERDAKREIKREREVMLERERGGDVRGGRSQGNSFASRRGEVEIRSRNSGGRSSQSQSSIELEKQREEDRRREIDSQVARDEAVKTDLRSQPGSFISNSASITVDRIGFGQSERIRQAEVERDRERQRERERENARRRRPSRRPNSQRDIERQRDLDRAQRGGLPDRRKQTEVIIERERPPILIYETIRESDDRRRPGFFPDLIGVQDTRGPDRPVAFDSPVNFDRRPGRLPELANDYSGHGHGHGHDHDHGLGHPVIIAQDETIQQGVIPNHQAIAYRQALLKWSQLRRATLAAAHLASLRAGRVRQLQVLQAGAIKTGLKHKLKSKIKHTLDAERISGATHAQDVQLHHHLSKASLHLEKAKADILGRLTLLKPYFKSGSSSSYAMPKKVPNIPYGVPITSGEVESLPTISLTVPTDLHPPSNHIPELATVVPAPLEPEFVEYLLNLPDSVFEAIMQMSKREFLVVLFPTLYRDSFPDLSPGLQDSFTNALPIEDLTSSYQSPIYPPIKEVTQIYPLTQTPSPTYGPPPKTPTPIYGPPPKTPAPIYGPPPKTPAPVYGPPPVINPVKFIITTTPATLPPIIITTPKSVYGPPKLPSSVYGPPDKSSVVVVKDCDHDHENIHHVHHHVHHSDSHSAHIHVPAEGTGFFTTTPVPFFHTTQRPVTTKPSLIFTTSQRPVFPFAGLPVSTTPRPQIFPTTSSYSDIHHGFKESSHFGKYKISGKGHVLPFDRPVITTITTGTAHDSSPISIDLHGHVTTSKPIESFGHVTFHPPSDLHGHVTLHPPGDLHGHVTLHPPGDIHGHVTLHPPNELHVHSVHDHVTLNPSSNLHGHSNHQQHIQQYVSPEIQHHSPVTFSPHIPPQFSSVVLPIENHSLNHATARPISHQHSHVTLTPQIHHVHGTSPSQFHKDHVTSSPITHLDHGTSSSIVFPGQKKINAPPFHIHNKNKVSFPLHDPLHHSNPLPHIQIDFVTPPPADHGKFAHRPVQFGQVNSPHIRDHKALFHHDTSHVTSSFVPRPIEIEVDESDFLPGPIHLTISEPVHGPGPIHVTTSQPQYDNKISHGVSGTLHPTTPSSEVFHISTLGPAIGSHQVTTVKPPIGFLFPDTHPLPISPIRPTIPSTTPVTSSTVVVGIGVGLRPHGSEQEFFSPISTTISPPFASIAPLFPTSTFSTSFPHSTIIPAIPITSFTERIPSSTYSPPITSRPFELTPRPSFTTFLTTPRPSFSTTQRPLFTTTARPNTFFTTSRPVQSTSRPSFTTTFRPFLTTPIPRPTFGTQRPPAVTTFGSTFTTPQPPFVSTLFPTTERPSISTTPRPIFVDSTGPPFATATFPSTIGPIPSTTPPVFIFTEGTQGVPLPINNVNSVVLGEGRQPRPFGTFPNVVNSDDGDVVLIANDGSLSNPGTVLQKVTALNLQGNQFDRIPGTDENDDIHIITPFSKRKGNATHHHQQTGVGSPSFQGSFPESGGWRPLDPKVQQVKKEEVAKAEIDEAPLDPDEGGAHGSSQEFDPNDPFDLYSDFLEDLLSDMRHSTTLEINPFASTPLSPTSVPLSPSSTTPSSSLLISTFLPDISRPSTTFSPSSSSTSSPETQVSPSTNVVTHRPILHGPPGLFGQPGQVVDTLSSKKPPMPQLVGGDGLPVPSSGGQQGFFGLPNLAGGAPAGTPPQITAADLQKLPAYLREAPQCATVPTNRSFCLMPQDYPSELAASLVRDYESEIKEIMDLLETLPVPSVDLSQANNQLPSINTDVDCQSEERTVELSWSRDVLGSWFVILQTEPFRQPVTVTTCSPSARTKGCRPLLQPRPLVSIQPRDPQPRPFVFEFPLPVACVYANALQNAATAPVTVVVKIDNQPVTPIDYDEDTLPKRSHRNGKSKNPLTFDDEESSFPTFSLLPSKGGPSALGDEVPSSFWDESFPSTTSRSDRGQTSRKQSMPAEVDLESLTPDKKSSKDHSTISLATVRILEDRPTKLKPVTSRENDPSLFDPAAIEETRRYFPRSPRPLLPISQNFPSSDASADDKLHILPDEEETEVAHASGRVPFCCIKFLTLSLLFALVIQR